MAKILCVLYDDPVDGYPKTYPRDGLPSLKGYPGGQTLPSPKGIDFKPGTLLGSVSGELGLENSSNGRVTACTRPLTRTARIPGSRKSCPMRML